MSYQHKIILNSKQLSLTINRLSFEIIENLNFDEDVVLIGMQPRGVFLSKKIHAFLEKNTKQKIKWGCLDATFFRDDFRRSETILSPKSTKMDVIVENKLVVLIDDVLYTGRSIRAALTAIDSFGRPNEIELLVLIDRRFSRHLPIQPDYLGTQIDAIQGDKVKVQWNKNGIENIVYIEEK